MARTPTQTTAPAELIQVAPQAEQQLAALQDSALTQQQMTEMFDLGRRLGQMETASFFSNICDEVLLSSFESAKKSKAWRLLKNEENQIFESFDEFCRQRFGYSYARLQQVSGNRNLIGQEAFEQAERLGLRQRDYNAIKALPAPD